MTSTLLVFRTSDHCRGVFRAYTPRNNSAVWWPSLQEQTPAANLERDTNVHDGLMSATSGWNIAWRPEQVGAVGMLRWIELTSGSAPRQPIPVQGCSAKPLGSRQPAGRQSLSPEMSCQQAAQDARRRISTVAWISGSGLASSRCRSDPTATVGSSGSTPTAAALCQRGFLDEDRWCIVAALPRHRYASLDKIQVQSLQLSQLMPFLGERPRQVVAGQSQPFH